MKNFLLFSLIILFSTINIFTQDFSGIKICINPGHGGFDSNDRFISETGFWESVGNLDKGLALRDILVGMNANIVMTRTTNTSADDLPLSQIVAIANSNNVDYFQSIHSNAYDGKTNYTLLLFQGFDNNPTYDSAKVMGALIADDIFKAHRTTGKFNRGDFDFYGTGQPYLGVFKGLQMPGTLSEGSFHDYIPESWRLRNKAYTRHEAWAIEKAFDTYFHLTPNTFGEIAGIVRDPNKDVTYYSIPSVPNDKKVPLNNIKVTLMPNNIVYNGDNFNNGFFLFDSLAAGQYKLIYEADGYFTDSSTVTVQPDVTVFADKFMQFDTTIAPIVLSSLPPDDPDSVKTTTQIEITFSRLMDTASVENAFSINPNATGIFRWENNNQKLIFTPDSLEKATRYMVSLSTQAKSFWNVPLDSAYTFSFTTKNRDRLILFSSYPFNNQNDISTTVQIRLNFDAPIFQGSLAGRVNLYNSFNERLSVNNVKIFSENGKGLIYFEPKNPLENNSSYKVVLSAGIQDTAGYILRNDVEINFTTEKKFEFSPIIVNDFESLDSLQFSQEGTDTNNTSLVLDASRKISGSTSGKLDYVFLSDTGGTISINGSYIIKSEVNDSTQFGVWIFGDNNNNTLTISLGDTIGSDDISIIGPLNWTGWKFKHLHISSILNSSNHLFYSIGLKKNINGEKIGELFFDDASLTSPLTDIRENNNEIPKSYSLSQNYPNPFNPSTIIKWKMQQSGHVTLKIYDILGNEVKALLDKEQPAGNHKIEFDGNALSSGVYFYTLKVNSFIQTKKLILLK